MGSFVKSLFYLLCVCGWMAMATTTQAIETFPKPVKPIPKPQQDAFYQQPSDETLAAADPGTILRMRPIDAKAYFVLKLQGEAWQLMYRTTDHHQQPVAHITTVLIPRNAADSGRKLLAYQTAYDGLTLSCAPSYQMLKGAVLEQALITPSLSQGWVVTVPDYEGPHSLWGVGANAGQSVLDAIRATLNFSEAGLDGINTPVGVMGYSGGALASGWAAELQSDYAPELAIQGVALGGLPVNLESVARRVDGTLMSGVYLAVSTALARAYPELEIDTLLNPRGRIMMERMGNTCMGQFLSGTMDPLLLYPFRPMRRYVTVPQLLDVPIVQQIIAENRMGQRTPMAPLYIYQGLFDELIPIRDVNALATQYCDAGVPVDYHRYLTDHIVLAVWGFPRAFQYMKDRLDGVPAPSNCR